MRGNAPQSRDSKSRARESSRTLEPSRAGPPNSGRPESMEAVREARASSAWSCNNPDHGAHATSKASTCNIASPVQASSQRHNPTHKQREQSSESPNKLASRNASTTNLGAQVIRVNTSGPVSSNRVVGPPKSYEPLSSSLSTAASSLSNDSSGPGAGCNRP